MAASNIYEERLGTDKMLPLVFKMALPAVAAQIVNLLYNIVDRIYIGHIPGIGTDALAGVGVTSSVIILVSAFSAIVSGGGAPLAAIALGQGNREKARLILGNGFVLLLFFTIAVSAVCYMFMEPVLLFTGASQNTIGYAVDYLSIYLAGTVFVQISVGLNTFINTQGRPGIAMLSTLIGAVLNIILDPVFIFALDMGVKGAAVATVISQGFSAAWVLGFLFSRKATLKLSFPHMRFDKRIILSIFGLGISPFIMASTESLVGFVLNTNLKGVFFLSQAVGRYMKDNKIKGNILNIASSSSLRPATSAYTISKWGIRGLTLGLAKSLAPLGIVVNGVAPGPTATPMIMHGDRSNITFDHIPAGRYAMPQEIANMAVFLTVVFS